MNNGHAAEQHNTASSNGQVIASQYGIRNNYFNSINNHYQNGLKALQEKLYARAADEFETFLSDARRVDAAQVLPDSVHDLASAHFHAALALLRGRRPGERAPEQIARIENHLKHALGYADGTAVGHQVHVLWALVKDDYYTAYGMPPPPPAADWHAASIGHLGAAGVGPLLNHIGRAEGTTWTRLLQAAEKFRLWETREPEPGPTGRAPDPQRRKQVRKYFVPNPKRRSPGPAVLALGAALGLLGTAVLLRGTALVVCLLGVLVLARWGFWRPGTTARIEGYWPRPSRNPPTSRWTPGSGKTSRTFANRPHDGYG